jgi:hypothetical protein
MRYILANGLPGKRGSCGIDVNGFIAPDFEFVLVTTLSGMIPTLDATVDAPMQSVGARVKK